MPQPTPFNRGFDFTDYQGLFPSTPLPGYRVDAELDGIAATLAAVLSNLALLQRDDGLLANGVVTVDSISAAMMAAISAAAPPGPPGTPGAPGAPGTPGTPGTPGAPGANAASPAFTLVTNTLSSGSPATAVLSGAYPNLTITFGVPMGAVGPGGGAAVLPNATYGDVVVSGGAGSMNVQHVLGGSVPSVVGHAHAIADTAGLQAALDAKQGLDATLTALAGVNWAAGKQMLVLTAADTFGLVTVGAASATDIIDRTAGDARYQPLDPTLTAFAAETWTSGKQVAALTAADTVTLLKVGASSATDLLDRASGDARYQLTGSYATTSQLAAKADILTTVQSFSTNQTVSDATHGGCYNKMTGGTTRTITFGAGPNAGHCSIWVNRGSVNMTIACSGGYYKDGAATTVTTNIVMAPGDKVTAFHEGSGVWTFEVV